MEDGQTGKAGRLLSGDFRHKVAGTADAVIDLELDGEGMTLELYTHNDLRGGIGNRHHAIIKGWLSEWGTLHQRGADGRMLP